MPESDMNGNAPVSPFPKRRSAGLTIDAEKVVESVIRRVEAIENDRNRGKWLAERLSRYAKYRGWLPEKTFPWSGCANTHAPILQTAELRSSAGLHNVVMTMRPLMGAKATRRDNVDKEQKITDLLDVQFFLEPGPELAERRFGDFISHFLQDGNSVAYTPWVRDERTVTMVRHIPLPPDQVAVSDYLEGEFRRLFPGNLRIELDERLNYRFLLTYRETEAQPREAIVDVFTSDDDTALELVITRETTIYDGPVMLPLPTENVLVTTRVTNLQPPSDFNPTGAPEVFLKTTMRLNEVKRLQGGQFNRLDAEGMEKIIAEAMTRNGISTQQPDREALERQKDEIEGRQHQAPNLESKLYEVGHLTTDFLVCFDRWDVNGDGLEEDVLWIIARDSKVLCEARLLTERWPADKPYRPLAEAVCIPVPDRWYGISLLELGEALYDLIKGTFDISFDAWTVSAMPWFFYAASSKLNADIMNVAPMQGIPVPGNPRETILFPNLPQRDQSTGLGIISLGLQFFERQMMQSDLNYGRVPTGKASALRTLGTTVALLQQGDVRADQLLLRLFNGLRQVARNFHRMNRHLLPPGKEIRVVGWDGPKEAAYHTIASAAEIDADVEFDFRPDFLLSNPAVLSQTMQTLLGVMVQPLMFQMGITDPGLTYRLVKDFIRSLRLDPKLYAKPPAGVDQPAYLAEEAITLVMNGQPVRGVPIEGAEAHVKKLNAFMASEAFGMLTPEQVGLFKAWLIDVGQALQQERLQAAATAFQQALQSGAQGEGGAPTTITPPAVGGGEAAGGGPQIPTGAEMMR